MYGLDCLYRQWGSYSDFLNNIATVTLPINYNKSNFLVLATDFAGTYTGINNKAIQNKNLNSISILQANEGNGDSFLWFSIGYKQWGMNRLNNSYDVNVEMNININNIFCAITTNCDNSISQAGVNIYI